MSVGTVISPEAQGPLPGSLAIGRIQFPMVVETKLLLGCWVSMGAILSP